MPSSRAATGSRRQWNGSSWVSDRNAGKALHERRGTRLAYPSDRRRHASDRRSGSRSARRRGSRGGRAAPASGPRTRRRSAHRSRAGPRGLRWRRSRSRPRRPWRSSVTPAIDASTSSIGGDVTTGGRLGTGRRSLPWLPPRWMASGSTGGAGAVGLGRPGPSRAPRRISARPPPRVLVDPVSVESPSAGVVQAPGSGGGRSSSCIWGTSEPSQPGSGSGSAASSTAAAVAAPATGSPGARSPETPGAGPWTP